MSAHTKQTRFQNIYFDLSLITISHSGTTVLHGFSERRCSSSGSSEISDSNYRKFYKKKKKKKKNAQANPIEEYTRN